MNVVVLGAGGFIGSHVAAGLAAGGHRVLAGMRDPSSLPNAGIQGVIAGDLAVDHTPSVWAERFRSVDAVVNAVGILRPTRRGSFEAVHVRGPEAVWNGCVEAGVRRVVQISALGDPFSTNFIGSKHRGDEILKTCPLDWTVLRPSVVYSARASYGGTALLRAMASLPGGLVVPGSGEQVLQPVTLEDLVAAVLACLENGQSRGQVLQLVGPEVVTLSEYLQAHRQWLGWSGRRQLGIPMALIRPAVWMAERLGGGPMGSTMMCMLEQGNVGGETALSDTEALLGRPPQSMSRALADSPAGAENRWHARLYLLAPVLRWTLAGLWIASGFVGLTTPPESITPILEALGLGPLWGQRLLLAVSVLDLVLGTALALRIKTRWVLGLMLISVVAYTGWLGYRAPALWLEPLGGLIKNLPLIPALLVSWALEDRR